MDRMLDEYKDIGEQQSSAMERVRLHFVQRFNLWRGPFYMVVRMNNAELEWKYIVSCLKW